ncbi:MULTISPECIES: tail fiber assembly protein [unclassified Serratia (in: enterobacteria)]|uniref:tail fiber assembly protein n=1 Tax=unclassified Serratia (in: enterobacteria) TaxID=2647522 RepID=UPI000C19E9EE|nr:MULTISPECIES: tail fiber assembly protein [unclassified Serratia (in: enterobacteria)]PII51482.1 hypothetical protein BMF85_22385 [Serratia sp. OLCL1]
MTKYFISVDEDGYISGMYIPRNEKDIELLDSDGFYEVSESEFKSIGSGSKYIGGAIVDGAPNPPSLNHNLRKHLHSSMIRAASEKINYLQDAIDFGVATDEEIYSIGMWRKYRIELNRIDPSDKDITEWPISP